MSTPATRAPVDEIAPAGPLLEAPADTRPAHERDLRPKVHSTRASRGWVAILPGLVVVAVGLVFILQNLGDARVRFFTASGTIPLAVSLLAAFALGALAVLLLGSIRILQLRKVIHRSAPGSAH
jgi:uncharacterized integral membrane protein